MQEECYVVKQIYEVVYQSDVIIWGSETIWKSWSSG